MNARQTLLFLALVIPRFAGAEPPELPAALPSPVPSPVWTPPQLAATPTPAPAPRSDAVAGQQADPPESTPEKKIAGEVFVDCGTAPYDFDKKNELNYFVRTITSQGEPRIYWGKDFPRALEEAGEK